MTSIRAGQVIDGRYRIDRRLGAGGMGVVFSADDLRDGGTVAIKFLKNADVGREDIERFAREVEATTRLRGPNVARTLGSGWLDEESPYLVMEYVDGEPLSKSLSRDGPLPVGDAVACAICACHALAEAHALGIVHRDVKPSNMLLLQRDPCVAKLVDFGASKLLLHANPSFTATDCVVGSPAYSSPEQIATPKEIDARSDIWGLGVTLYTLLTARAPFAADGVAQTYQRILNETPSPLHVVRADVPRELSAIVARCLRKDREERFPDVRALADALRPFAREGALQPTGRGGAPVDILHAQELTVLRSDSVAVHEGTLVANLVPPPFVPMVPATRSDQTERLSTARLSGATTTPPIYVHDSPYAGHLGSADRRWSAAIFSMAAALIVATFGGILAWRYGVPSKATATLPQPETDPRLLAPAPSVVAPAVPATETSSPALLIASVPPQAAPPPPLAPRSTGAPRKVVKPPEGKPHATKADCREDPFVIDSEGIKSFRTECM